MPVVIECLAVLHAKYEFQRQQFFSIDHLKLTFKTHLININEAVDRGLIYFLLEACFLPHNCDNIWVLKKPQLRGDWPIANNNSYK